MDAGKRPATGRMCMNVSPKTVRNYVSQQGNVPFEDWLQSLRDRKARAIIRNRLNRVRRGNRGDAEPVGDAVFELRIHYGPGYRVYYGELERTVVILLCGGTKSSQRRDIERAKAYWQDLRSRINE